MAGIGDSWGTREELLHPRDKNGRFRSKWKMAEGVVSKILAALAAFNPRTFQSDGQASQYLHNKAKPSRFGGGQGYARLSADFDAANDALRAGSMDASTQKFVKMMDDSAIDLPEDIIVSRRVGPEAFGLTPETMGLDQGGIEDFTGKLIADRGYTSSNIGTPLGTAPIQVSIAVPKGTKAIIPGRSPNDRQIYLDRDQEIRVTKVDPDGRGGYYVLAVAQPRTPGQTPEPVGGPGAPSTDLAGREGQVEQGRQLGLKGMKVPEGEAPLHGTPRQRTEQGLAPNPADLQGPVDTGPGGPPPRNEPVVVEALGQGGAPQVTAPPAGAPEVPGGAPETPIREADFKEATKALPIPSAGKRRREWNQAYLGIRSGKRDPDDLLRELSRDIEVNKGTLADQKSRGDSSDPQLADDIAAQEQLADLIRTHHDIDGKTSDEAAAAPTPEPVKAAKKAAKAAPAKKATKAAPAKTAAPAKKASREDRVAKLLLDKLPPDMKERVLADMPEADRREVEAGVARVEAAGPPAKRAPAKAIPTPTPEERQDIAKLDLPEKKEYRTLRREGKSHADALQGARDRNLPAKKVAPVAPVAVKKATPTPEVVDREEEVRALMGVSRKPSISALRAFATEQGIQFDPKDSRGELINSILGAKPRRGLGVQPTPIKKAAPVKRTGTFGERIRARQVFTDQGIENPTADQIDQQVEDNRIIDRLEAQAPFHEGVARLERELRGPKKAVPKKSVEGASPGTAAGKITSLRLTPGTTVLIHKDSSGAWRPTTRKTGATKLTVTGNDALSGRGGRRQVSGTGPDGEEIKINVAPVQTFIVDTKGDVKSPASDIEDKSTRDFAERVLSGKYILRVGEGQSSDPDSKTNPPELADTSAKKAKALKTRAETMRRMAEARFRGTPNAETEAERIRTFRNAGLLDELADEVHKPPAKKTSRQLETEANNLVGKAKTPEVAREITRLRAESTIAGDLEQGRTPDIEKMTKPELIAEAKRQGVDIRPSWTKPKIKEAIELREARSRAIFPQGFEGLEQMRQDVAAEKAGPDGLNLTVRELQSIADSEGVPRRGRPKNKAALQDAIRARREEVANLTPEDQAIIDSLGDGPAPAPTPATPSNIMERLNSFDNPPTRDEAHEMVKPLLKRDLVAMGKELSVPGAQGLTKEKLRDEIVEATAGRRRDSIATRGFRGARPDSPEVPEPLSTDPATREIQVENRIRAAYRTVLERHGQSPGRSEFVGLADIRDELGEDVPRAEVDRVLRDMTVRSGDPNEPGAVRLITIANSKSLKQRDLDSAIPMPGASQGPQVGGLHAISMADPSPRPIPTVVANPVAQKVIKAPDRKSDFDRAWEGADLAAAGSAGRSLDEIQADVSTGKITPDEGIRRLETEIDLNIAEIADMDKTMRGDLTRDERKALLAKRLELTQGKDTQIRASAFLRKHFKKEPLATPDEVKVELDEAGQRALDDATPDGLRQAALAQGIKVKGETKEEILKDLVRQMAGKELERRTAEAKKVAPAPKAPDKPKPNLEQSSYQRIDTQALAEGLDLRTEWDQKMLAHVQEQLDGTDTSLGKNPTPAQIGRNLEKWANGPAGPFYKSAVSSGVAEDTPEEIEARERWRAQGGEWLKLADRLKNTRRRKKEDRAPDVTPTVSKDEKKDIAAVAEVTGIPAPELEAKALAKKKAEAPPKQSAVQVAETLKTVGSREEAKTLLQGRTKAELMEIAKATGTAHGSSDTKPKIIDGIVSQTVGGRLTFEAIMKGGYRRDAGSGGHTRSELQDMSLAELVGLEDELGIQRASLNRGDRIDAILAKQAGPSAPATALEVPAAPDVPTPTLALTPRSDISVHGDSQLGQLWDRLPKNDQEQIRIANRINDLGIDLSVRRKDDASAPQDVIDSLKALLPTVTDPGSRARIDSVIKELSVPSVKVPDSPALSGSPPSIQTMVQSLAKIPVARKTGRMSTGGSRQTSVLDEVLRLIQDIDEGKADRGPDMKLADLLRTFHESVEGAYQMWNLEPLIRTQEVRKWILSKRRQ